MLMSGSSLLAQSRIEKPKDVIILHDKIVTLTEVEDYMKKGQLKAMNKGVTQEKSRIHGDAIGDREFITIIELRTEEEMAERKRIASNNTEINKSTEEIFFLVKGDEAKKLQCQDD